jgi:hypothetical protein
MCHKHTTHKELKMKLEMAVHGLNVNLELDDSAYNGLEILQHVKDLVDELSAYDKVMLSVVSIPDEENYEEMSEEEHVAQAAWPFPEGGLDDQGTEIIAFVEPEHPTA